MTKKWTFRQDRRGLQGGDVLALIGEPYLAAVGRVVLWWSHVEFNFHVLLLFFVAMKGRGRGNLKDREVIEIMGAGLKAQIVAFKRRMVEVNVPAEMQDEIGRFLDRLSTARDQRDRVAHSVVWPRIEVGEIPPEDTAQTIFKSWKNQKEHEWGVMTVEELGETYRRMQDLYRDLFDLSLDRSWRGPHTSHGVD